MSSYNHRRHFSPENPDSAIRVRIHLADRPENVIDLESLNTMDKILNGKYRMGPEIGRGADGIVYRAVSIAGGDALAIKVLTGPATIRSEAVRLEYEILYRLRHPHILPLLDFGNTDDGSPFWVMPFIDCWSTHDFRRRLTPETTQEYLLQIVQALDYLHRMGIIHGDLKPGNILTEKRPEYPGFHMWLTDFGMARLTPSGRSDVKGGSFPYLAPEALVRGWIDPRSDLFSLGVILSETICGRLPFETMEEYRRLLQPAAGITRRSYPPPMSRLGNIADTLMAPDPNRRFQSSRDVLIAAGAASESIPQLGMITQPAFSGRSAVIEELDRIAGSIPEGNGKAVFLDGEAGSGKTRVLLEWDARCRLNGLDSVYYAPGLGTLMGDITECFGVPSSGQKVQELLAAVRKSLTDNSPCIRIIDGLDAADPVSTGVFSDLIRTPPPGVLFVFSLIAADSFPWNAARINLGPISESDIRFMIRSRCVPELPERLVDLIAAQGGRLPGRCNRVFDTVMQSGMIAFHRNAWHLMKPPELLESMATEPARHLFETLDPAAGDLLGDLACLGRRIDIGLINEALEADPVTIRTHLAQLLSSGMIRQSAGHLEIDDMDLARHAVSRVPADRRRTLHRKAAARCERVGGDRLTEGFHWLKGGVPDRAILVLFGSAVEMIRRGSIDAAVSLLAVLQNELKASGDAGLKRRWSGRIALEKGNALMRSGDYRAAIDMYREAIAAADRPEETVTVMGNLATALARDGRTAEALEILLEALTRAQETGLDTQQGILNAQTGNLLFQQQRYAQAEEAYGRALPGLEKAGNLRVMAAVWNNLGSIREAGSDFDGAFNAYTRGLPLKRQIGDHLGEAVLRHNIGHLLIEKGRLKAASKQLEKACQILDKAGETPHRIQFLGNRAIAEMYRGHFRSALQILAEADPRLHDLSDDPLRIWLLSIRGRILMECGNPEAALQVMNTEYERVSRTQQAHREYGFLTARYRQALGLCGHSPEPESSDPVPDIRNDPLLLCEFLTASALTELSLGHPGRAEPFAIEIVTTADEHGLFLKSCSGRLILAEIWMMRNNPERALHYLTAKHLERLDQCGAMPLLARWTSLTARAYDESGKGGAAREADAIAERVIGSLIEHLPPETDPAEFHDSIRHITPAPVRQAPETGRTPMETPMDDRQKLAMLLDVSGALNRETDLNVLLERIVDYALELTGAERGFLYLKPDNSHDCVLVTRNIDREAILGNTPQISTSVMQDVLRTGRAVMMSDSLSEDRFKDRRSILAHNLRTVMCVPLVCSRNTTPNRDSAEPDGILYVDGTAVGPRFGTVEKDILVTLATHAGIGMGNLMQRSALSNENQELKQQIKSRFGMDQLIGTSPPISQLKAMIRKVAHTQTSVMIFGESGTGKELVARIIHFNSSRAAGPFLGVNCAALSETILESELFGVEAGVATGVRRRSGLFIQANHGTLFLDEIGDMPLAMQAKILRVLQERSVRPVGGRSDEEIDVRIICATNRDLWSDVREGRFREDLLYRLDVVSITLPPLRDRIEDIPMLAHYFLARHAREMNMPVPSLSLDALKRMAAYPWPGNVRELENQMQRALVLTEPGGSIRPGDLSPRICQESETTHVPASTAQPSGLPENGIRKAVDALETAWILQALEVTRGNKAEAARILGLSREGLRLKIRRLNLDV